MTYNGKIGRLPRNVREELNRQLDDGEPGGKILAWLNARPEMQAAGFGGRGVNAQNLSNWRKGGFQQWLKQQERRNLVRELTENASELGMDAGGVEISSHLSALLVAEFAASARDALAAIADPAERCVREQEFLQTLVRVRRQDNQAGKLALERERRARERVEENEKDENRKQWAKEWEPMRLQFKRSYMADLYAQPNLVSQAMANHDAETLLRGVQLDDARPPGSTTPLNPGSN